MKYKEIKNCFVGCNNKREVLDALTKLIGSQIERYVSVEHIYDMSTNLPCDLTYSKIVITIEPRFTRLIDKAKSTQDKIAYKQKCVGYDVKVEEKPKNS